MTCCIYLKGLIGKNQPINDTALQSILAKCQGPITVVVDSEGGDVSHGLACHALLATYDRERGEVTTIARRAFSAGGLIFCAGSRRGVEPGPDRLMIHAARGGSDPMLKAAHALMLDAYCFACSYGDAIREQINSGADVYYSDDEAKAYGLATFYLERPVQSWEFDHVVE